MKKNVYYIIRIYKVIVKFLLLSPTPTCNVMGFKLSFFKTNRSVVRLLAVVRHVELVSQETVLNPHSCSQHSLKLAVMTRAAKPFEVDAPFLELSPAAINPFQQVASISTS